MRHANPKFPTLAPSRTGDLSHIIPRPHQINRDDKDEDRYEKAYRNTREGGRGARACWRTLGPNHDGSRKQRLSAEITRVRGSWCTMHEPYLWCIRCTVLSLPSFLIFADVLTEFSYGYCPCALGPASCRELLFNSNL